MSPVPPSTTSSRRARSGQADEKARLGQPRPYVVFQHQSGRYPHLANDVSNHNQTAESEIRTAIERKLTLAKSTITAVSALGIPIKRRDEPPTFAVPAKRRESPAMPQVKAKKRTPVLEEDTAVRFIFRGLAESLM